MYSPQWAIAYISYIHIHNKLQQYDKQRQYDHHVQTSFPYTLSGPLQKETKTNRNHQKERKEKYTYTHINT